MDTLDWIIAGAIVILLGISFYFLYPPYGVIVGLGMGVLLMWQAKKRREKARKKE